VTRGREKDGQKPQRRNKSEFGVEFFKTFEEPAQKKKGTKRLQRRLCKQGRKQRKADAAASLERSTKYIRKVSQRAQESRKL